MWVWDVCVGVTNKRQISKDQWIAYRGQMTSGYPCSEKWIGKGVDIDR